jgi:tetratricopeptide (TPR) repeat protein
MVFRFGRYILPMFCLGCHSLAGLGPFEPPPSAAECWALGQAAMRQGLPAQAVGWYHRSLDRCPEATRVHLSLAAAYLALDDRARAAPHLGRYVAAHPGETALRVRYADLLWQVRRDAEARAEFEHCVEAAQQGDPAARSRLIHCHSRLMEIAEANQDVYGEHLHRGIGLYLLARKTAAVAGAEAELPSEGLFCKAAGELTLALEERPDEARPSWYLYQVWSRLAQRRPARRCLREARRASPFSFLTPAERRDLQLADQPLQLHPK